MNMYQFKEMINLNRNSRMEEIRDNQTQGINLQDPYGTEYSAGKITIYRKIMAYMMNNGDRVPSIKSWLAVQKTELTVEIDRNLDDPSGLYKARLSGMMAAVMELQVAIKEVVYDNVTVNLEWIRTATQKPKSNKSGKPVLLLIAWDDGHTKLADYDDGMYREHNTAEGRALNTPDWWAYIRLPM